MLKACLYLLFFAPWTLFCSVTALLSTFLDRSGSSYHRIACAWSRVALLAAGVRIEVTGAELIPSGQPVVFMGNHQSSFDILTLFQAIPQRFNWLAKEELFKLPLFGTSMRAAGYIPISRGDGRDSLKSLDNAATLIRSGTSIVIFPEGTRSNDGRLLSFKRGGFILAAKAGVPIVPFSISGSMNINPPDNFLHLRSGVIRIRFSPAVASDARGSLPQTTIMEKVRQAIADGLES
jgi:1-acyl-sn-glycerol-3-phosphate acyltransferase